jgi:hypothetical protein
MIAVALVVTAVATAVVLGLSSTTAGAKPVTAPTSNCTFANGIKHVIQIQFDNTHFLRDRRNVPSDLEQMPHLLNFIRGNGTLLTNDHTVLISHTATGILSTLTGVYPDRMGQPVSNSFRYFRPGRASVPAAGPDRPHARDDQREREDRPGTVGSVHARGL